MLKRITFAALTGLVVICCATVADAADIGSTSVGDGNGGSNINTQGHDIRDPKHHGQVESHTTGTPSPTTVPAPVVVIQACYMPDGAIYPPSVPQNFVGPLPSCPSVNTPTPGAPLNPGAGVRGFVTDYFRQIPVPKPQPEISAQNGGICGVLHSLDLHMQPEMLYKDPGTPFGDLTMHVYGTITVNWGDGTINTYTDGGAEWPNSDIQHSWNKAGTYTITATANWTAVYSIGPYQGETFTGALTGITTTGSIPAFQVIQAQAVLIH